MKRLSTALAAAICFFNIDASQAEEEKPLPIYTAELELDIVGIREDVAYLTAEGYEYVEKVNCDDLKDLFGKLADILDKTPIMHKNIDVIEGIADSMECNLHNKQPDLRRASPAPLAASLRQP